MGIPKLGYWGMPLGCRFHPTDQELISYLRRRVIAGEPLGIPFLHEFNLFGSAQPWVVWENFGGNSFLDQDLFLFYELQHSKKNNKRSIDAGGSWKATSFAQVEDLDGIPIGEKRNFSYKNKGCEDDGEWLLEEYCLLPIPNLVAHSDRKVVLSRLKRSSRSRCANMNLTQEFNEKPPIKKRVRKEILNEEPTIKRARARKDLLNEKSPIKRTERKELLNEKPPIKKRARKELLNEKLPIKRARKELGSQNTTVNVITNSIDQSSTPSVVPFDEIECNMNHDDECISNIDGNVAMPMNDVSTCPICFGSEEEFLLSNEKYLGEIGDFSLPVEGFDFTSEEESLLRTDPLILDFDRWLGTVKLPQEQLGCDQLLVDE